MFVPPLDFTSSCLLMKFDLQSQEFGSPTVPVINPNCPFQGDRPHTSPFSVKHAIFREDQGGSVERSILIA